MTDSARRLMSEIDLLPPGDRAELAQYLLRSLDVSSEDNVEAAWDAELKRRAAEIQDGNAPGEPVESVFAQLRQKYL